MAGAVLPATRMARFLTRTRRDGNVVSFGCDLRIEGQPIPVREICLGVEVKISEMQEVDVDRFQEHWKDDEVVLSVLANQGDHPQIEREIDFAFEGVRSKLDELAANAKTLGFDRLEREDGEDGKSRLVLYRNMKADRKSLEPLIKICLQLESQLDVEFDGWGCEAQR